MMNQNNSISSEQHIFYYDILRVLAMSAVVVLHAVAANWVDGDVTSHAWNTFNVYNGIVRWCVPVFVMISGALFLDPGRDIPVSKLFKKHIPKMLAAFIVWSFVYALIDSSNGKAVFLEAFLKGKFHLWYLYLVMGLYLSVPVLRRVTASKEITRYFIIISASAAILLPLFLQGLSILDRFAHFPVNMRETAEYIASKLGLQLFLGYSCYFVLGYLLSKADLNKGYRIVLYVLGALGFAAAIIMTKIATAFKGESVGTYYGYFSFNTFLQVCAVFVFCRQAFSRSDGHSIYGKAISFAAKYSFGVYLSHVLVLEMLAKFHFDTLSFTQVFSVPILSLIIILLSLALSFVLRHIPLIGKYIT